MPGPYIFTTDVQINSDSPGLEYNGTETGEVWHEDREITGVMYRASNATYDPVARQWSLVAGTANAYASAQNTDGSISYLYMPAGSSAWASSAWLGYAEPSRYYAVNYGFDAGNAGSDNTTALTNAVAAIIAAKGGTLQLPAGKCHLSGGIPITGSSSLQSIIIEGVSGQTELIQDDDLSFIFNIQDIDHGQSVTIKDMRLSFGPMNPTISHQAAVNVTHCTSVVCERVFFHNCPTALLTDDGCLKCGLFECVIAYNLQTDEGANVNDQTMVILNGAQDFITGCVIRQQPINNEADPGPTGCTGVLLGSNNNGRFITDSHISDFYIGVQLTEGLGGVFFSDVLINAYHNAVIIQPSGDDGTIGDLHFTGCTFALTTYGDAETSGVVISTNGGANHNVSCIYFTGCSAFGFGNAGIEIDSGENIVITGGQYSSNGQNPTEGSYLGAGIAVAGGDQITISGADCSGINDFWQYMAEAMSPTTQPYGISVSGLVSDVLITGCHLPYNATNGVIVAQVGVDVPEHVYLRSCNLGHYSAYNVAVSVASAAVDVQITDCAGYDDQNAPIPISGVASTQTAKGLGFYGPSVLTWSVGTGGAPVIFTLNSTAFSGTSFGSVYLSPFDQIKFSAVPAHITWVLK